MENNLKLNTKSRFVVRFIKPNFFKLVSLKKLLSDLPVNIYKEVIQFKGLVNIGFL